MFFFKTRPGYIGAIFTGSGFDIVVVNKVAYVAVGEAGIKIIDVSDPGEPVLIADFDTPGLGKGIEVVGSSVYVADGSFGLQVIDISNPAKPSSRGSFLTVGSAVAVTVADGFVYVSCGTAGISVFRAITTTRDQLPFD